MSRKAPPSWDVIYRGSAKNRIRHLEAARTKSLVYYSDTKRTGTLIRHSPRLNAYVRKTAHRVRNELSNTIPLGDDSRDGHLKHQLYVRRGLGPNGRTIYYIQSADKHPRGEGKGFAIANSVSGAKGTRPTWVKQTLKRMEIKK